MRRKLATAVLEKPIPKPLPAPRKKSVTPQKRALPVETTRVTPESILAGGRLWKMSGRHSVAYVQDAALAGELLATDPRNLPKAAMAVYYDKKGRAFAWQVRFDAARWEELAKRLG